MSVQEPEEAGRKAWEGAGLETSRERSLETGPTTARSLPRCFGAGISRKEEPENGRPEKEDFISDRELEGPGGNGRENNWRAPSGRKPEGLEPDLLERESLEELNLGGEPSKPLLEVSHVFKTLGKKLILDDVSLTLSKGDLKVLIGPSGGGKSTLLQCVHFLDPPDSGDVILDGLSAREMGRRNICGFRREIGMIFQDFNLFDHLTALENVSIAPRKVKGLGRKEARERAMAELARVGLEEKAGLYPAQLSGGQKQRVSIARAMAMDPKIMLLDEPTSALDPELIGEVLNVIADLAKGGMTMLMVTHQIGFARHLTNEILFMEEGKIVEKGSPSELLGDGSGSRAALFLSRLTELTGR